LQKPPLDPDVADTAPSDSVLTVFDEEHLITYLRLLDADAEGTDWRDVARIVLHLDPEHEACSARQRQGLSVRQVGEQRLKDVGNACGQIATLWPGVAK
jgi:hypothetical protein